MSIQVIEFVREALRADTPVALVTLTESGRDTPGIPGAMMAVCADRRQQGTIGGGLVEAKVIQSCLDALAAPAPAPIGFDYSLHKGQDMDMLCGGQMKGIIQILRPQHRLIIFGGGHVGQKLYEAGRVAGFSACVVEDRAELAASFKEEDFILTENLAQTAKALAETGENYLVIVTRGHAHDFEVLSAVAESGAPYIGMIGSRHKVRALLERLRQQGVSPQAIDRIYSPVGLYIDNGTPGEIAIGILAEILAVKNNGLLQNRRSVLQ